MNKVIELECMTDGITFGDEPCERISTQMKDILESNPDYKFVSLVYHPTREVNMEYASLIVEI